MDNFFKFWNRSSVREVTPTPGVPNSTSPSAPGNSPVVVSGDWKENVILPTGRKSLVVPAWFRGVSLIMQTM